MPQQRHAALPKRLRIIDSPLLPVLLVLLAILAAIPGASGLPVAAESETNHDEHGDGAVAHQHQAAAVLRFYVPIAAGSASAAPQPSATPRPGSTTTPRPVTPTPRPSGAPQPAPTTLPSGLEPVAADWITKCPADTVPFEGQGWWMNDFGHVHIGMCAPNNWRLSGSYTADAYVVMFRNPGLLKHVQLQIDSTDYVTTVNVRQSCPAPQTCVFNRQIPLDLSAFDSSGWHQLRVRATVEEPDGKELVASSFIPVYIENGKPRRDYEFAAINGTTDYIAGRGWYTGAEYVWSVVFDPPVAGQRISGVHTFRVRPRATGNPRPVSYFVVKLDATHTAPGTLVYESRDVSIVDSIDLSVDTRTLADGWHSLVVRSESAGQPGTICQICSGQPQTHAGDTKVWFFVDN